MKIPFAKRGGQLCIAALAIVLVQGCSSNRPQPLYQWEGYQPQVYAYLKGEGSFEEQIAALEKGLQVIRSRGNTPPPGYHAHLGLLYAQIGQGDQVVQQFRSEEALFPESGPYMAFLLKQQDLQEVGQ